MNPNGTLDVTFGTGDGKYAHFFGGPDFPVHVITDIDLDKNGKLVETLWRNSTTQLGFNDIATGTVLRYLTDITVGAHKAQYQIKSARLSPNLVADEMITLEYTLDAPTEVSVSLFDLNGRYITNLVTADYKTAGIQTEYFYLPAELPAGSYVTVISGGLDYQTIPIVKTR